MWATIQSAITIGWAKNDKGKEDAGERLEIPMAFAFYSHIQNMAPSKKPAPHVWNIFAVMSIMHFSFFFPKKSSTRYYSLLFEGCLIFSP